MVGNCSLSRIYPESLPLIYDLQLEVPGSTGAIKVDCRDQMIHKMTEVYSHSTATGREINGKQSGFTAGMLSSFIDNVRHDNVLLVDLIQVLYCVKVIDTIHQSIISGKVKEVK